MTKTDILINTIGAVGEKYACETKFVKKSGKKWLKRLSAVAAAALILTAPLPTATACGIDEAYHLLYAISPKIAQTFKSVNASCEDNGIKMEVVSASIEGDKASFLISMQGDMLDETVDLFDSYHINCPFDSYGSVSLSEFDKDTKTAYFLVNIGTMNGENIRSDKVTFSVREILCGKKRTECAFDDIDLSQVPVDPPTTVRTDWNDRAVKCLIPRDDPIAVPVEGAALTGLGYVDGALHIQTFYENIRFTDNHGFVDLIGENGESLNCPEHIYTTFWAEGSGTNAERDDSDIYYELIIPVEYERLKDLSLKGEFLTSKGSTKGDWEVTFKLK